MVLPSKSPESVCSEFGAPADHDDWIEGSVYHAQRPCNDTPHQKPLIRWQAGHKVGEHVHVERDSEGGVADEEEEGEQDYSFSHVSLPVGPVYL